MGNVIHIQTADMVKSQIHRLLQGHEVLYLVADTGKYQVAIPDMFAEVILYEGSLLEILRSLQKRTFIASKII